MTLVVGFQFTVIGFGSTENRAPKTENYLIAQPISHAIRIAVTTTANAIAASHWNQCARRGRCGRLNKASVACASPSGSPWRA